MAITIDSDAHVIESDRTWEFMTGPDAKHKPTTVAPVEGSGRLYWIIDGKLKARRTNIGGDTTEATREVADVEARLRHMDDLGTDIQVLYPTIYTRKIADDPAADFALGRSYNPLAGGDVGAGPRASPVGGHPTASGPLQGGG